MAYQEFGFTAEDFRRLLGHQAAEDEPIERLKRSFYVSAAYNEFNDDSRLCVLVAHKGVGKSALLRVTKEAQKEKGRTVITLLPEDIYNIPVSVDGFIQKVKEWMIGLRSVITRKVCRDANITRDDSIIGRLVQHVISSSLPLDQVFQSGGASSANIPHDILRRLHAVVALNPLYIFIDDLDLGWHHDAKSFRDIERIATLFQSLRYLSVEAMMHFRVSVRSDIFYLAMTAYVDVNKIRSNCRWHKWSNHDIIKMFAKKIITYNRDVLGDASIDVAMSDARIGSSTGGQLSPYFSMFLASPFSMNCAWRGEPTYRVLLTLIRKRPRDFVALIEMAAQQMRERVANTTGTGSNYKRIQPEDLMAALPHYSQFILIDTITEYRGELPDIHLLLRQIGPTADQYQNNPGKGFIFSHLDLVHKLRHLIASDGFGKGRKNFVSEESLRQISPEAIANGSTRELNAENLLEFLYRINFIVLRTEPRTYQVRYEYFDESRFDVAGLTITDEKAKWEIHPAYRWALTPVSRGDVASMTKDIALTMDY